MTIIDGESPARDLRSAWPKYDYAEIIVLRSCEAFAMTVVTVVSDNRDSV